MLIYYFEVLWSFSAALFTNAHFLSIRHISIWLGSLCMNMNGVRVEMHCRQHERARAGRVHAGAARERGVCGAGRRLRDRRVLPARRPTERPPGILHSFSISSSPLSLLLLYLFFLSISSSPLSLLPSISSPPLSLLPVYLFSPSISSSSLFLLSFIFYCIHINTLHF